MLYTPSIQNPNTNRQTDRQTSQNCCCCSSEVHSCNQSTNQKKHSRQQGGSRKGMDACSSINPKHNSLQKIKTKQ
jgi:hypothetical protein